MDKAPETEEEEKPAEPVGKLLDKPSDFRFHAAYVIYSDAWERTSSQEIRQKLNELLTALSTDKIDYGTFYHEMNQYRVEFNPEHFRGSGRPYIETRRKRDWRARDERERRNKRHGR